MKSFKQYQEDAGGAGGGATVGAASGGAIPTTTTAGIKTSVENPPMSKKAQKKYVASAMEQTDPNAVEQQAKSRATSPDVRTRLVRHKVATERESEHSLRKRSAIVKNIPNIGTVPSSSTPQRRITGATNMESFANFHKKNTKIKAADSSVGPQTFMAKEDTLAVQKLTTSQNAKTDPNPTGFAKSSKDRFIKIGNQVLNKQKEKNNG